MAILVSTELSNLLDFIIGNDSRPFLDCAGEKSIPTFRFNPLKHSLEFQRRVLDLEEFGTKESILPSAFQPNDPSRPIGKSLSHFLGHIYIQDLASMLPPILLNPQPGEKILDLCAAPGSKTTQLASLMLNEGIILANDSSQRRLHGLIFNLRRSGVANTGVFKWFGEQYGNHYFEFFDRVLLDPPCSALGTIRKSPEVLSWWEEKRSRKLAANQKSLMQSALKALRPGGILVYSTCTLTPEENEEIVDFALSNFPVELEEIHLPRFTTRPGLTETRSGKLDSRLARAIRLYPFENPCEGFFIARLRKLESFRNQNYIRSTAPLRQVLQTPDSPGPREALVQLSSRFGIPKETLARGLYWTGAQLHYTSPLLGDLPIFASPSVIGLPVAHLRGNQVKITTEGSHLFGHYAEKALHQLGTVDNLQKFVNREPIQTTQEKSVQVMASFEEFTIGHAILTGTELLSRFPRTGWKFCLTEQ